MMRRFVAAGLLLLVAGCGQRTPPELRIALIGDSLAPGDPDRQRLSYPAQALAMATAQGLVGFDAQGQIEPALAQSWIVTDDGLSYIFRLRDAQWADGSAVTAQDAAQALASHSRSRAHRYRSELADIASIKAMTKRVIEIRLKRPMPYLLDLLAQAELGILRNGSGSGPLTSKPEGAARLLTPIGDLAQEPDARTVRVEAMPAATAVSAYTDRKVDAVLGGRFQDYPLVTAAKIDRRNEVLDPAEGLFGFAVRAPRGILGKPEVRRALSQVIDRDALVAAFSARNWQPRDTLGSRNAEEAGYRLDAGDTARTVGERQSLAKAQFDRARFDEKDLGAVSLWLPKGAGADLLLERLKRDWGILGLTVVRAQTADTADLVLLDEVSPSRDPFWLLERLSCGHLPVCNKDADAMVAAAPHGDAASRAGLYRSAAARLGETAGFLPLATPLRWSLSSGRTPGLDPNIRARHPLNRLGQRAN